MDYGTWNSPSQADKKTLNNLEYNAPAYTKDDYMRAERDTPSRES